MDEEVDESFLRLKYGYPLTMESYSEMPDELVNLLYSKLRPEHEVLKVDSIRLWISADFETKYRLGDWTTSSKTWNIIRKYHATDIK